MTELLNSRIVDVPSGVEERKFELVPSTPIISYGRREESQKSPAQDGVSTHMVSTRVMSANVGILCIDFFCGLAPALFNPSCLFSIGC